MSSAGLGLAVVDGCRRLPPGLVGRVVPGLPVVRYRALVRDDAPEHGGRTALLRALRDHRDDWRSRRSVAAATLRRERQSSRWSRSARSSAVRPPCSGASSRTSAR